MPIHRNPVDDKVRSARKRHGARAALWALLTSLYASGRDAEAAQVRDELRRRPQNAEDVLRRALALPGIADGLGEGLVGWVALRYQRAERSGDPGTVSYLEDVLPRAAYPITEWQQRDRPRPNLFDMDVHEAYEAAKAFLEGKNKEPVRQGPIVYRFADGYTVQDLNTKALLVDEGNHQHICVGQEMHGYPQRMERGEIKVYSVRDAEGRPHATLTWSREKQALYEGAMAYNQEIVGDRLMLKCSEFGRHLGMSNGQLVAAQLLWGHHADCSNEVLDGMDFVSLYLEAANFNGASMVGTNLADASLSGASFVGADLRRASLYQADLEGADLVRADLRGAYLADARLSGCSLNKAVYDHNTTWPKNMTGRMLEALGALFWDSKNNLDDPRELGDEYEEENPGSPHGSFDMSIFDEDDEDAGAADADASREAVSSARRGDVLSVGKSKWVVFQTVDSFNAYVYKHPSKGKKAYVVRIDARPDTASVWQINGMAETVGEPVATGPVRQTSKTVSL